MRAIILILIGLTLSSFSRIDDKPAKARITVIDENNMIVAGATVILFANEADYKAEENSVAIGVTNEKGYVEFKNLSTKIYYIHVEKGDLNNHGGNVKTGKLDTKGKNRFEIMIN